jgi:ZIP family zinc transporter
MVAASFWSLLLPALESSAPMGTLAFLPAAIGFLIGVGFLLLLDMITPHMHMDRQNEGPRSGFKRTTKLILAVTLHNIPEGMAVGVVFAGWASGHATISLTAALSLAIGIAIQNFPEGAIISLPLHAEGASKTRALLGGAASGIVEPLGALLTIVFAQQLVPWLPYLLGFAAGAMVYVVVEELVPEMTHGGHSHVGVLMFAAGFTLMMALDVALG